MDETRYPLKPQIAVTGPFASSRQRSRNLYHLFGETAGSGTTSTISKIYVCKSRGISVTNLNRPKILALPFAARSSPLLIVVPTAMYSLLPVSVLVVSSVTHDIALMNSFVANSNLGHYQQNEPRFLLRDIPIHGHPRIRGNELQRRTVAYRV